MGNKTLVYKQKVQDNLIDLKETLDAIAKLVK
jgi:hypothetical protein